MFAAPTFEVVDGLGVVVKVFLGPSGAQVPLVGPFDAIPAVAAGGGSFGHSGLHWRADPNPAYHKLHYPQPLWALVGASFYSPNSPKNLAGSVPLLGPLAGDTFAGNRAASRRASSHLTSIFLLPASCSQQVARPLPSARLQ